MWDLLPDLCDDYPNEVSVTELQWQHFGAQPIFTGEVVTVRCPEDNSMVKIWLAKPGHGKVLVVDGGGMLRRALLGDMLAQQALDNGWAGIVIHGALRDVGTINRMAIGVKALGVCPVKTDKRGLGDEQLALRIGGVEIRPGDHLYADLNGVLISRKPLPVEP